ncbi:MAG: M48 family metallopeptidase [Kouleothrix sp.]|nr:M48 family metallopeptidase [Kouleothrix sp.]
MSTAQPQTITVDGVTLTLLVERKRVKNINARLRDSTLSVSAPLNTPQAMLDQVIPDLARRLVRRVRARQINAEESALDLAHQVAARFPNKPSVAQVQFVTTQEARWGSYSSATRTIRLNAALRHMPRWVLEAVVAHELAHVTHHDHGPGFWKLLRGACPEVDRADAFLAGVSWLGRRWEELPPVERALLTRANAYIDDGAGGVEDDGVRG